MAQAGDTITYTYDGDTTDNGRLIPEQEDISSVDEMTVKYLDGSGGSSDEKSGGVGGRVENTVIDLSGQNTLYIWVASPSADGRYRGGTPQGAIGAAGGSAEISFINTNETDSSDEPYLVAAAGGGGSGGKFSIFYSTGYSAGSGGARGGAGGDSDSNVGGTGQGDPPPLGGSGGDSFSDDTFTAGGDGEAAVANRSEILETGMTTKGGGSPSDTNAEVQISYGGLSAPDPPSNLSAEVQ